MEVKTDINLSVDIAGIKMKNPVMVASGTFGYGEEYCTFFDLSELGAIVTKSITLRPRQGNRPPRIAETPSGMLNAIGLQNVGIDAFISEKMPFLRTLGIPIIVSISGEDETEYIEIAERLSQIADVSGLEINISCPNVAKGGMQFGSDSQMTYELINSLRCATNLPLIVKLSPNVTDIVEIAKSAEQAGADALSLINTFLGMSIDIKSRKPKLGNITGGLSGPAIRPIAVRMVWQVFNVVKIPLIGMGGIMNADDALEFIIAGATAVSIGTANFVNPTTAIEVIKGIEEYMQKNEFSDINDLIGCLNVHN
ncbi:TPA: dihydroorotate dehydrogenase [Candidatus Poribacteria bacterium]|nr:dihydroorotate dehydrogenase [Candidatus Poribacteria bacterium]